MECVDSSQHIGMEPFWFGYMFARPWAIFNKRAAHPAARSGAHHRHANAGASKKWNANQTCNANKKTARSPTPLHAVAPTTDTQMLAPPKDGMPTNNAMPI